MATHEASIDENKEEIPLSEIAPALFSQDPFLSHFLEFCDIVTVFQMRSLSSHMRRLCDRVVEERTRPAHKSSFKTGVLYHKGKDGSFGGLSSPSIPCFPRAYVINIDFQLEMDERRHMTVFLSNFGEEEPSGNVFVLEFNEWDRRGSFRFVHRGTSGYSSKIELRSSKAAPRCDDGESHRVSILIEHPIAIMVVDGLVVGCQQYEPQKLKCHFVEDESNGEKSETECQNEKITRLFPQGPNIRQNCVGRTTMIDFRCW